MKVINRVESAQYGVKAYWERRAETPDVLAARFVRTIVRLQEIDPVFALWTCVSRHPKKFETVRDRYAQEVAAGVIKDDWGEPEPIQGYRFGAVTRQQQRSRTFDISVRADSTCPWPFPNDVTFLTEYKSIPDPAVITYGIFKSAVLAVANAWNPLSSSAYPLAILNLVEKGRYFRPVWIQYLCP